jgi:hypothetical protein
VSFHEAAMLANVLGMRADVAQRPQDIVRFRRARPIRLGFFHDAAEILEHPALSVHALQNLPIKGHATEIFEPRHADAFEIASQIAREFRAGF